MREITTHKVNDCSEAIVVHAMDGPGPGGGNHEYRIQLNGSNYLMVNFQNGPIGECGTNGVTHEALLAILIDRLEGLQKGPFAHGYNADALKSLMSALASLKQRTRDRVARGVEGTHTV
jgi:hypothetical protein